MNVTKTQNTPEFTAKYLLKGTLQDFNKIKTQFMPDYMVVKKNLAFALYPDEIFRETMQISFKQKAKTAFNMVKTLLSNETKDMPQYLREVKMFNNQYQKKEQNFYNFAQEDCKLVKNLSELSRELLK